MKELNEMTDEEFSTYRKEFDRWHAKNMQLNRIQTADQPTEEEEFLEGFNPRKEKYENN